MRPLSISLCLASALLVQLWYLNKSGQRTHDDLVGPTTDSLLPTIPIRFIGEAQETDLRSTLTANAQCSLVIFMDVNCGYSKRLRHRWTSQFKTWSDSIGSPIQVIWLFGGKSDKLESFLQGYDLGPVRSALVGNGDEVARTFGVIGTPMAFVVDSDGRMRVGVAGTQLPPATAVSSICGVTTP